MRRPTQMRRPMRMRPRREPRKSEKRSSPPNPRDRLATLLGLVTVGGLLLAFVLGKGTQFLMPGPLASAHGAIENCGACHTKSGTGKVSWLHGLVAPDPAGDSKACLTCHKMPDTAFNAHSASPEVLKISTKRLTRVAGETPAPVSARAQNAAFPTHDVMQGGLYCATCHQEHKGVNFDLNKISNEQCQSCHVVKFDSFDGNHPQFENYPFARRTRITYDHVGHFGKHFPEVAQKDPKRGIPTTCSTCHNSRNDKRIMAVAPFAETCTKCHLDQITGKERATGPKGIAFLSLPGLDLETLKSKNAAIGEWPDSLDVKVTPFMKVLLAQTDDGRALVKRIDALNLSDLSDASDDDIAQVTKFVWRVKRLLFALVTMKASDVLAGLDVGGGLKASGGLLSDLTAGLPRDVVIAAQQEWLPNLGPEIAIRNQAGINDGPVAAAAGETSTDQGSTSWSSQITESKLAASARPEDLRPSPAPATARAEADSALRVVQNVQRVDPSQDKLLREGAGGAQESAPAPARPAAPDAGAASAAEAPAAEADKPAETEVAQAAPEGSAAVAIESDIDAESWADQGGWYRQDFAILYRPVGHKDKFIYSWLVLTGMQAKKDDGSPASAVFDALIDKDAQGSCTKCHSVDNVGKGRQVNFGPATVKMKEGRFTNFLHEPHFGVLGTRGCLTCHNLKKNRPYLKSYQQGNPLNFDSNFIGVKKEVCIECHRSSMARNDCLTCHKYHVNGVVTPIMNTKIPAQ